jgi:hypothetical protein
LLEVSLDEYATALGQYLTLTTEATA